MPQKRCCQILKIRGFVEGEDEKAWIWIQNEAYREYDDFRPDTRKTNS